MASEVRIGTSGWSYKHWRNVFYPSKLRAADQLAHYTTRFDTVELNGVFYRLPSESAVGAWATGSPPGFRFAWKASKYITHAKKLLDASAALDLMRQRTALLGEKLGPILFQLPPQLERNDERLADFLGLLDRAQPHAIEFRHPSWYDDKVFRLLSDYGVALCISDHHHAPAPWVATASFVYVRGHGPGGHYVGRYPASTLARWARQICQWRDEGREAWVYFDNDIGGAAPVDAESLSALTALG